MEMESLAKKNLWSFSWIGITKFDTSFNYFIYNKMIQAKTKESIVNGVGVKQYAIVEEANKTYRPTMEDSIVVS